MIYIVGIANFLVAIIAPLLLAFQLGLDIGCYVRTFCATLAGVPAACARGNTVSVGLLPCASAFCFTFSICNAIGAATFCFALVIGRTFFYNTLVISRVVSDVIFGYMFAIGSAISSAAHSAMAMQSVWSSLVHRKEFRRCWLSLSAFWATFCGDVLGRGTIVHSKVSLLDFAHATGRSQRRGGASIALYTPIISRVFLCCQLAVE